jgi:hypothetical protein
MYVLPSNGLFKKVDMTSIFLKINMDENKVFKAENRVMKAKVIEGQSKDQQA